MTRLRNKLANNTHTYQNLQSEGTKTIYSGEWLFYRSLVFGRIESILLFLICMSMLRVEMVENSSTDSSGIMLVLYSFRTKLLSILIISHDITFEVFMHLLPTHRINISTYVRTAFARVWDAPRFLCQEFGNNNSYISRTRLSKIFAIAFAALWFSLAAFTVICQWCHGLPTSGNRQCRLL
jgi:hypothetical protein